MPEKIERDFDRSELADYLESLAGQIRSGTLTADGRSWTIPDRFSVKIRFKEKKGRMAAKLAWRWSTLSDYGQADRQTVDRWRDTFKSVKKRLSTSFRELKKAAEQGGLPDAATLSAFLKDSRAFGAHTDPEWQGAMDEYMDHLDNLERAFQDGHVEAFRHELRDLGYRMASCHREFKS